MSRRNRVRALVAPAAVVAVLPGSLGLVSVPAMADDPPAVPSCTITLVSGDPSKAAQPSCGDVSGTDQDWYFLPYVPGMGGADYYVDGSPDPAERDEMLPTNGAPVIAVQSQYWDGSNMVDGPAWTLTFNTAITGTEAEDTYSVRLGNCGALYDGYTPGWVDTSNTYDGTGLTHSVDVLPKRSDGWEPANSRNLALDIPDGGSGAASLGYYPPDLPGLLPGKYKIRVYAWDKQAKEPDELLTTLSVFVPKCGDEEPPDNGQGGDPVAGPKAKLLRTAVHRMRAVLMKGDARAVRFRIKVDPPRGATTVRRLKVTAPRKAVVLRDLRFGTRVKVRAYYKGRWHTLAAKRLTA